MSSLPNETIIRPSSGPKTFDLRELMQYRDLLLLLIRRDFVARYKQTILGPLWAILQPVMTAIVFTVVFGKVAKIPTDEAPPFLFYLSGMLFWQLFAGSVSAAGNSLQANATLFTKVYFPRIIPSLATLASQLIPFSIQFGIFTGFYIWYLLMSDVAQLHALRLIWLPVLLLLVFTLALGISLTYSALTAKYRDLNHALGFLIQLGLYVTPVIYPVSQVSENWRWLVWLNPMAAPITTCKWIFLDAGALPLIPLLSSMAFAIILLPLSMRFFHRIQRTFVDTV
ncbi:ABC transporter permease [Cerasicoccus maritimus]|uniref:ABC transporter permease n=1 Tax=Cerasicoccus maritimus TaxID=490089 RepID=UPI002852777F|nr:ABC transporter permease [Cerasicoccus maritimus]